LLCNLRKLSSEIKWSSFDSSGGVVNRTGYYTPQVLIVSLVVKQFYTSVRALAFDLLSLAIHTE